MSEEAGEKGMKKVDNDGKLQARNEIEGGKSVNEKLIPSDCGLIKKIRQRVGKTWLR